MQSYMYVIPSYLQSPKFLQLKLVLWYTVYIDTDTKFNNIIPAANCNKEKRYIDTHTDCTVVLHRSQC